MKVINIATAILCLGALLFLLSSCVNENALYVLPNEVDTNPRTIN